MCNVYGRDCFSTKILAIAFLFILTTKNAAGELNASSIDRKPGHGNERGNFSLNHSQRAERPTHKHLAVSAVHYAQYCFKAKGEKSVHLTAHGGGFGSMFQNLAARGHLAIVQGAPFDIRGQLRWYTNNSRCDMSGWECHFVSPRKPQPVSCTNLSVHPAKFTHWELYSAVQLYMWQPNTQLVREFNQRNESMALSSAAPIAIAMHIRGGDKITDIASKQTHHHIQVRDYLKEVLYHLNLRNDTNRNVYIATDEEHVIQEAISWSSVNDVHIFYQNQTRLWHLAGQELALVGDSFEEYDKYDIAVDLLFDIHQLMQAEIFIGLCMSQIARMVLSMRYAKGIDGKNIAMDSWNIKYTDNWKYGKLEGWHGPVTTP